MELLSFDGSFAILGDMEKIIETMRVTRNNILNTAADFSIEQLNTIPEGFSNNLIWNMAHVLVTQQLLVYRLSGLDGYLENGFIDRFRKGSKPDGEVGQEEVSVIREQLVSFVDQTEQDWKAGKFESYKEYPTSFGVTLGSTEDAMRFNNSHEALHLGYMMAMRKLV